MVFLAEIQSHKNKFSPGFWCVVLNKFSVIRFFALLQPGMLFIKLLFCLI